MGKKRPDRGAEGTGRRAGAPLSDSERSRAWEVDLVARCWLICYCALCVRPRARPPWAVPFLFLRELCFFCGDEKHCSRSISRRGTSPFFRRPALNLGNEICHLL